MFKVAGCTKDKTEIAARVTAAVKEAKPVNRSPDLVPLCRDYEVMHKELKSLISSAKAYHEAMIQLSKARRDVSIFIFRACGPFVH